VVECTTLERWHTGNGIEGSNPSLSAVEFAFLLKFFSVRMMDNNVEEIKARLNIVDLVGEYVRLTKAGANWKGLCPFHHEKSPSFMVNEEKQIFHCFGCSKGGDMFTFVQEMESLGFREAMKLLAEKAGVQLEEYKGQQQSLDNRKRILAALELATKFYETQLWKGMGKEKILGYLYGRALTDESIKEFRLGYAPDGWRNILNFLTERGFSLQEISQTGLLVEKNQDQSSVSSHQSSQPIADDRLRMTSRYYDRFRDRIMFPIMDTMGAVVGYSARVAPGGDESQAKYVNTPETAVYHKSKILYGISHAKQEIKKKDSVLLVEGNMDVIASHQAGIKNTVAVSGTALTQEQVATIKRYTNNINMLFDMDSAGQSAAERSADLCFQNDVRVRIVNLKEGKDAADAVQKDPTMLIKAVEDAKDAVEHFFDAALKKHDQTSAQGKQKIAKDVLVHIACISNQIEMSHWVKKIAHKLDVEENVIIDVLKSLTESERKFSAEHPIVEAESAPFQKRSDIIRDSLLGLVMSEPGIWKEIVEKEGEKEWAMQDRMVRFILQKGPEVIFMFDRLVDSMENDKAKERLRSMYFAAKYRFTQEGVIEYSTEDIRELVGGYICQYVKELQKERLHSIIKDIQSAEKDGDREALAKLMGEFTELSKQL
jgi:DNA primase